MTDGPSPRNPRSNARLSLATAIFRKVEDSGYGCARRPSRRQQPAGDPSQPGAFARYVSRRIRRQPRDAGSDRDRQERATITVLWKVAAALGVPVAQLISDPEVSLYTVQRRKDANAETQRLRPAPSDRQTPTLPTRSTRSPLTWKPGRASPTAGRRLSQLGCGEGAIEIVIGDEPPLVLEQGDAIHFSAGLKHTLANPGGKTAILYRVVGSNRKGQ